MFQANNEVQEVAKFPFSLLSDPYVPNTDKPKKEHKIISPAIHAQGSAMLYQIYNR